VVISTQVLIELRSVATRKLRPALSERQISALLEALCGFEVVSTDPTLLLDAHQLAIAEQLSQPQTPDIWDGADESVQERET